MHPQSTVHHFLFQLRRHLFLTLPRCCKVSCRKLLVINPQDALRSATTVSSKVLCNHCICFHWVMSQKSEVRCPQNFRFCILPISQMLQVCFCKILLSVFFSLQDQFQGAVNDSFSCQLPPRASKHQCHGKGWIPEEEHLDPLHHSYLCTQEEAHFEYCQCISRARTSSRENREALRNVI